MVYQAQQAFNQTLGSRKRIKLSRIIGEVCYFFNSLDIPTMKFQLFCVLMLTANVSSSNPVCHCNIIIWLVFARFVSSVIPSRSESLSIFCTNDVMCRVLWRHLSFIPYQFSIFEDFGGLTALHRILDDGRWTILRWIFIFIIMIIIFHDEIHTTLKFTTGRKFQFPVSL